MKFFRDHSPLQNLNNLMPDPVLGSGDTIYAFGTLKHPPVAGIFEDGRRGKKGSRAA